MNKFVAIEGLRGWMAWWVVLGHGVELTGAGPLLHPILTKFFASSYLAVQVFMIVSGFVITHVLSVKRESYRDYIIHRWFRLMPLLLVMLVVTAVTRDLQVVAWIDNPWISGGAERIARMAAEERLWPVHLLLHLTLLHGVLPDQILPFAPSTFLAPAWSLSLEWQFYLLAPAMIAGLSAVRRSAFTWLLIGLSAPTLLGWFGTWTGFWPFLLQNLPFFLIGIASRQALDGRVPTPALLAAGGALLVMIAIRGLSLAPTLVFVGAVWSFFMLLTAREAGLIRFGSRWFDGLCYAVAYNPLVGYLGRISYSTYLCHVPIFSIVLGGGMAATGRSDQAFVLMMVGTAIALTLPASYALYRRVEQPGVALGKRLLSRQPAPALN